MNPNPQPSLIREESEINTLEQLRAQNSESTDKKSSKSTDRAILQNIEQMDKANRLENEIQVCLFLKYFPVF